MTIYKTTGKVTDSTFAALGTKCREISAKLTGKAKFRRSCREQRPQCLRSDLYLTSETLGKLIKQKKAIPDSGRAKTVARTQDPHGQSDQVHSRPGSRSRSRSRSDSAP